jgi:hypothetical protein
VVSQRRKALHALHTRLLLPLVRLLACLLIWLPLLLLLLLALLLPQPPHIPTTTAAATCTYRHRLARQCDGCPAAAKHGGRRCRCLCGLAVHVRPPLLAQPAQQHTQRGNVM